MGKKSRRVNYRQVLAQVEDAVGLDEDGYLGLDIEIDGRAEVVWARMPVLDEDGAEALFDELADALTARDKALILLDGREDVTAEEQLALFEAAGHAPKDLLVVWQVEAAQARGRVAQVGKPRSRR